MNILTEHGYGTGAVKYIPKKKDFSYKGIAMSSQPFDWSAGYDVEVELSKIFGNFKIPVKNQGTSSSCGGQAGAYKAEVADAFKYKIYNRLSAKFIYAPIHAPGGGSGAQDICKRTNKVGVATEGSCPSYINNLPPDEPFMERVSDITTSAIQSASLSKSSNYAFYQPTDIETIAAAIRDNQGVVLGISGANNGTWLSTMPVPPKEDVPNNWQHWIFAGKAKIINGKKYIGLLNSWGPIGDGSGWQWVGEDYLPYIWCMFTEIFAQDFQYVFIRNLYLGCSGVDVVALQQKLRSTGDFTYPTNSGFFGTQTMLSVIKYQSRKGILPTGFVGPITRQSLSSNN